MTDERTLPQARKNLADAVHRLTAPQHRYIAHKLRTAPSRYHQLASELAGTQGDTHTPAKSIPPLWIDATQLLADIDRAVARWERTWPATTPERLTILAEKSWRPQDTQTVTNYAMAVSRWSDQIDALLDPQSVKSVSAACPACGATHVYRNNSGDRVRQAALQIVTNVGCTCQACNTTWGPELYLHLARVLGFETPAGVLE